ncbi:MAG TPA: hypothetical protein VKC17_12195, partial [Sphingomicrobium sp.]|nr:hypothetical protein [Sphingomicrobium sp.]
MTMMTKILAGAAGLAAIASAAPSTAQYYQTQPYGYGYGYRYNNYGYGMNTNAAVQQCTSAVQNRLYSRGGAGGILGALVGSYGSAGRVLSITRVDPNRGSVRVRGLASSGRYAYGYGGYGAADLSFKCDVDYRGYVRDI